MSDEENAALVIKAGIEQLFAPVQRLLDQLLGPAATEVGLTLGDSVRMWRVKRGFRFAREFQRLIEESGKDVKPIATRLFFPVLEAASIEDDDEMQTRWAALIANEATDVGSVHPSYIDILRQLAPQDARVLDKLCDWCEQYGTRKITMPNFTVHQQQYTELKTALGSHEESLDNLLRLGMVQPEYDLDRRSRDEGRIPTDLESWYYLTDFAVRFVRACRAPIREQK